MACKFCDENRFKEKLGRCKTCIWLNLLLLVSSAIGCFIYYQSAPREVATIALLLTFIASGFLMLLHAGAYLYYRFTGVKHPTQDRHSPK
ncbi:DUF3624 domain-containing protein [Psychromonas antarctica]|jgi:hypothetical protein|uniref:DUF3624 domain-containing protein n=1 Tax=Psychromonas antarctica TaxID=67573 RepID=UPI001EE78F4B|nr:DUF3624 domain-containing protein [Psychromonas antarctica]MCG6201172.1 DUF3624 domain-containing protein [Psychromonas antarctica]